MTTKGALKIVGIACAGIGIGAAAALLYAPQSGKRTRRDLRRFGERQVDRVRDLGEDLAGYMENRMAPVVRGSEWIRQKMGANAS